MAWKLQIPLLAIFLVFSFAITESFALSENDDNVGRLYERRPVWQFEHERLERLKEVIESPYYSKELPPPYYFYERRFFFGHPYYGYLYPYGYKYPRMYWYPYGYRWPQTDPYDYFAVPDYIYPSKFFGYPSSYYRDHCRERCWD
jgi:hypothetical protein